MIDKSVLLAVQFPSEMLNWVSQKKVEYLQELGNAVSAANIQGMNQQTWQDLLYRFESTGTGRGQVYRIIYSLIKACEQGQREVIESLKIVLSYRHPSQIYQAFLEGLLPFLLVWWVWRRKPLKAGIISCVWLFSYNIMRMFGEQFRMPDAELGFRAWGLTRGQWLSLTLLICTIPIFLIILKNKSIQKWGGWTHQRKT